MDAQTCATKSCGRLSALSAVSQERLHGWMGWWGVYVEVGGGRAGSRDTVTLSQDARRQPWDKKLIITLQVNGRSWREKWGGGAGQQRGSGKV